jgi:hypothetical protein
MSFSNSQNPFLQILHLDIIFCTIFAGGDSNSPNQYLHELWYSVPTVYLLDLILRICQNCTETFISLSIYVNFPSHSVFSTSRITLSSHCAPYSQRIMYLLNISRARAEIVASILILSILYERRTKPWRVHM